MPGSLIELKAGAIAWRQYLALCKPGVVSVIVLTALVGMCLASPVIVPASLMLSAIVGICLAASSAAAINHVVDRRIDQIMRRTQDRPMPTGRLSPQAALWFALILALLSMGILFFLVNPLTAALAFFSLIIGYGVIYSVFLKYATPQNIVIGGAAGAFPPILGWTSVTGSISAEPLLFFLIIFAWTPPHFWALAIHRLEEYKKADIPMLPVTHGVTCTRLHILLYAVLTAIASVLPVLFYTSGLFYLAIALPLSGRFLFLAARLYFSADDTLAMPLFIYSIYYLIGLFMAMLVDHYLPWPWGPPPLI